MAGQPGLELLTMRMSQVEKADSGLGAGVLPRHFGSAIDQVIDTGEGELDTHSTTLGDLTGDADCHPSLTEVDGGKPLLIGSGEKADGKFDGHADVAAAFALHECAGSTETGSGALERDGFVEDKVGAQGKSAAHGFLAVNYGDGNGAFVTGSGADAAEDFRRHVLIDTIDDDGFEPVTGQAADGGVGIGTGRDPDFEIA